MPLEDSDIATLAPSVFASNRAARTSERYSFIDTKAVLSGLRDNGWLPVAVKEQASRADDRIGYQKHAILLRHRDIQIQGRGDIIPQICLVNSHDGSSGYMAHVGVFRVVCMNGLVAEIGDSTLAQRSVRHSGSVDDVIDITLGRAAQIPEVVGTIQRMQDRHMTLPEMVDMSRKAIATRWEDPTSAPFSADFLSLTSQRYEDRGSSLWLAFNRVQEAIIKGGVRERNRVMANGERPRRPSQITAIGESIKTNRELWAIAESYLSN